MRANLSATCPVCHSPNDGHTDTKGSNAYPKHDDISICAYCGTLGKYQFTDAGVKIVEVDAEEMKELLEYPEIRKALAIGRALSARLNG